MTSGAFAWPDQKYVARDLLSKAHGRRPGTRLSVENHTPLGQPSQTAQSCALQRRKRRDLASQAPLSRSSQFRSGFDVRDAAGRSKDPSRHPE